MTLTKDPDSLRRKALRQKEPIFRQQSPALQYIGHQAAMRTSVPEVKDALSDLDLLVWDESDRYFLHFSHDLADAPYTILELLAQTSRRGRPIGLESALPPLVAAFTVARILAGGDAVYDKYLPLLMAIESSQHMVGEQGQSLYDRYCQFLVLNKRDPCTGQETIYRRGDPAERIVATPEEEADKAQREAMLQEVLQATRGWNCPEALSPYWPLWQALWQHLLGEETLCKQLARKCPRSQSNTTPINIRLVAGVAGLMKRHLGSHRLTTITDKRMAEFIRESWSSDECRKSIGGADGLTREQVRQIEGWMNINVH